MMSESEAVQRERELVNQQAIAINELTQWLKKYKRIVPVRDAVEAILNGTVEEFLEGLNSLNHEALFEQFKRTAAASKKPE